MPYDNSHTLNKSIFRGYHFDGCVVSFWCRSVVGTYYSLHILQCANGLLQLSTTPLKLTKEGIFTHGIVNKLIS